MAIQVLSMDPGKTNFGASVLRMAVHEDKLRIKVVAAGMLMPTVQNPLSGTTEVRAFNAALWALEHQYGPFDGVVAERFQARGLKGLTIECINLMLGTILGTFPNTVLYTASTWKNSFNRACDFADKPLAEVYEMLKVISKPRAKADRHQIHELDSSLMGIYHGSKMLGVPPFETLREEKRLLKYVTYFDRLPKL